MPTMAGYSSRSLPDKLGIKPGLTVYVDRGPSYVDQLLDGVTYTTRLPRRVDISLLFTTERSRLEQRLPVVLERTESNGMIWACWPKKASKVPTDLDENVVRDMALATGIVDVKVAAVDETWSGLKLVRRLKDR
jgi:hypothetical protein